MGLFSTALAAKKAKRETWADRLRHLEGAWDDDAGAWLSRYGVPPSGWEHSLGTVGGGNHFEIAPGPRAGTAESIVLALTSEACMRAFLDGWCGTVQWTEKSPFRPEHKRKNWFVGVEALALVEATAFDASEAKFETMRASGPGGQHVNRTESAVRVTHVPTGLQASASEERSQHRNRKLALARLAQKIAARDEARREESRERQWTAHQNVERGNPVRVFRI